MRRGILDKLQRLVDECVILAHMDKTRMDDPTVVPAYIFYAGLASSYDTDESHSIGQLLREVANGVDMVEGWSEPDALVLYRATLGVPIYFFRRVTDELSAAYRKVKASTHRGYPLHIDRAFESDDDLPDLDPIALRRARERAQSESEARAAQGQRTERLIAFSLCAHQGSVLRDDKGWRWQMKGFGRPLASGRAAAYDAFWALEAALRDDMVQSAQQLIATRRVEVSERRKLADELASHEEKLAVMYYEALANERAAESRFLEAERAAMSGLIDELRGA
ncbi:MAG: hypothetical protein ACI9MC_001339 [Kiritimatiellia bacterium]